MSNLKHLSLCELLKEERDTIRYIEKMNEEIDSINNTIQPFIDKINSLNRNIGGQKTKLDWIEKYKQDKTHIRMTHEQIEKMLGQKIIIVD